MPFQKTKRWLLFGCLVKLKHEIYSFKTRRGRSHSVFYIPTVVDKRSDSAHSFRIHLAEKAIKEVPEEECAELLSMDISDAEGVYHAPVYLTPEEWSAVIMKHLR